MDYNSLVEEIDSCINDLVFTFRGKMVSICPFSQEEIHVGFDGNYYDYTSLSDFIADPIFDGNVLKDVCGEFE
jgi:DNA-directed RNA polymerase subunit F